MASFSADVDKLDKRLAETVTADDTVFTGRLLKVHRLTVTLPNGKTSTREMIRHPGAAAIVVLDDENRVVLERQWRTPAGGAFWEIPAGKIDPGEKHAVTARRELKEEAGLTARDWVFLGTIRNAIGYSDEHIEIYLARGLTQGEQRLDANEFLTLTRVPLEEALAACRDGTISDVKTIIGLMWAEGYIHGRLTQARSL